MRPQGAVRAVPAPGPVPGAGLSQQPPSPLASPRHPPNTHAHARARKRTAGLTTPASSSICCPCDRCVRSCGRVRATACTTADTSCHDELEASYGTGLMSATTSRRTRSGERRAAAIATLPPSECPSTSNSPVGPARSLATRSRSSAMAAMEASRLCPERPWLRRSMVNTSAGPESCGGGGRQRSVRAGVAGTRSRRGAPTTLKRGSSPCRWLRST